MGYVVRDWPITLVVPAGLLEDLFMEAVRSGGLDQLAIERLLKFMETQEEL